MRMTSHAEVGEEASEVEAAEGEEEEEEATTMHRPNGRKSSAIMMP